MWSVLVLAVLAAAAWEATYCFTPTLPQLQRPPLWIVGNSVSAGDGRKDVATWPKLLAREQGIEMTVCI
jgi:uncharacterized membrane protein